MLVPMWVFADRRDERHVQPDLDVRVAEVRA